VDILNTECWRLTFRLRIVLRQPYPLPVTSDTDQVEAESPFVDQTLDQRLKNIAQNWGKGRPRGTQNKVSAQAREFAQNILTSPEYRASLVRRIQQDDLPPVVETLLYHYAYGKPKERIEVSEAPPQLDELTMEQLQVRAAMVFEKARQTALLEARTSTNEKVDV
jgi:hypothetical protein